MQILFCIYVLITNAKEDVTCNYGIAVACFNRINHHHFGLEEKFERDFFTCEGSKLFCNNDSNMTLIAEYLCPPHTNPNIESLALIDENLKHVPKNLDIYFPNLRALVLNKNIIADISNNDFLLYKELELIELSNNEISSLDTDIFDGLMNLKVATFHHNKIKNIGHDITFPSVVFDLTKNFCTKEMSVFDRDLNYYLLTHCPPTIFQIKKGLKIRENLLIPTGKEINLIKDDWIIHQQNTKLSAIDNICQIYWRI